MDYEKLMHIFQNGLFAPNTSSEYIAEITDFNK